MKSTGPMKCAVAGFLWTSMAFPVPSEALATHVVVVVIPYATVHLSTIDDDMNNE